MCYVIASSPILIQFSDLFCELSVCITCTSGTARCLHWTSDYVYVFILSILMSKPLMYSWFVLLLNCLGALSSSIVVGLPLCVYICDCLAILRVHVFCMGQAALQFCGFKTVAWRQCFVFSAYLPALTSQILIVSFALGTVRR